METRHREEKENLAHCLVSSGGGWTQGFLPAAPDRGAPPPVNSPVESSQYTHSRSACAFTCNVTCQCSVLLCVCLHHFKCIHRLTDCAIQWKMEADLLVTRIRSVHLSYR